MYPATINNVRFSLIPSAEPFSGILVKTRDLFKNNKPAPDGVYSAKQGTTDNSYNCETCFNGKRECLGHAAIIELNYPLLNPSTLNTDFKKWIRAICFTCGGTLIKDDEILNLPIGERMNHILKQVKSKSIEAKLCPHCSTPHPKVTKDKKYKNFYNFNNRTDGAKSTLLMPGDIEKIFARVTNETVLKLGISIKSHPSNFVRRQIIVTPPQTRTDSMKLGSTTKSTVDEHTSMYQLLVEKRNELSFDNDILNEVQQQKVIEYNEIYYNLIKGKDSSSLAQDFVGKTGEFRKNMMGKRIRVCCRNVIANSIDIKIDELAIPFNFAKIIQMRDRVQEYNRDILIRYVRNAIAGYPGASRVVRKGKTYRLDKQNSETFTLEIGDEVHRDLIDGDPTPFCRQPSLMISNISTHKIRVMMNPQNQSYLMNVIICPYYNADFDGDEMNQFICSGLLGRNEAQKLSSVPNWVISNTNSNPLIGQVEDSLIGLARLTRTGIKFDKYHACLLFQNTTFMPDLSFMKPGSTITGHDIISILLEKTPINFSRNSHWVVEAYKKWIKYNPDDAKVEIVKGKMIRGILDWASVGKGNNGSIYHIINNEYGEVKMLEVMYNMQQVGCAYLSQDCLSVGLCDMMLPAETKREINLLSADIINKANEVTNQLESGNIIPPIGETVESFYEKQQTEILTIMDIFYPAVLSSIDINNNGLFMMIACKSKGKITDMLGMISAVGQRSINGQRVKQNFGYKRTLPYYPRFDTDPYSRGYVGNAYIDGITKTEYIFGAMQVRFDLIVKALSTSVTGDQNRQSIKNLEPIIVNNFRWAIKHRNVIQFAYGEDYLDPRKLILVKFGSVTCSDVDLKNKYFHADFPAFYDAIVADRNKYREAYLKIESINIREIISDNKKVPVDIERILRSVLDKYDSFDKNNDTLKSLMAIIEEFIENIPYIMLNNAAKTKKLQIPNFVKTSVFLFVMLCRITLHPNAIETLLKENRINNKILNILLERIFIMYLEALIDPGTAVGNIAAQCFSEPLTQYMLDAHTRSQAGGTSKSSMTNVKEILGARPVSRLTAPSMILPVIAKYASDFAMVQKIANNIEMIDFKRFILSHQLFMEKFGEPKHSKYSSEKKMISDFMSLNPLFKPPGDLVKRCLRIVVNKMQLLLKNMSLEYLIRKLYEDYPNIYIVYTPENSSDIILRIYFRSVMFKEMASITELRKIRKQIIDTTIRGVANITNVEVIKLSRTVIQPDGSLANNSNCWAIKTTGTNLAEMLTFPDIDHANVQTTAVQEIKSILGIGAARQRIITELSNLGMECSNRHLLIYADEMTHSGDVTSIERHGIKSREPNNILLRMGFSSPITTLEEAMVNNTVDELSGITPSYLVGTVPSIGTKYNKLIFNEAFIAKNVKSADEMLSSLL